MFCHYSLKYPPTQLFVDTEQFCQALTNQHSSWFLSTQPWLLSINWELLWNVSKHLWGDYFFFWGVPFTISFSFSGSHPKKIIDFIDFHNQKLRGAIKLKNVPKSGKSPQFSWPPSPRMFWTFLNLGKIWNWENFEFWEPPLRKKSLCAIQIEDYSLSNDKT